MITDGRRRIKKSLSLRKELSRTFEFQKAGGSFVVVMPDSINAAAQNLQNIASSINQSNATASGTQGIPPAFHQPD